MVRPTGSYFNSHFAQSDIFNSHLFQIQAGNGEVTITNDGATILQQMSVTHPAAKMVISRTFLSEDLCLFVL